MLEQTYLRCIELEQNGPVTKSLIWLHGLGADGNDFAPIVPELKLPSSFGMRFIFPHAPTMSITINNGYIMPAWYDVYGFNVGDKIDAAGIAHSVTNIVALIEREIARGIAPEHIFLAGFSQGAVVALITGLGYSKRLAGIIALSGYLPLADEVLQKASTANHGLPIFLGHGTQDSIVPWALGKMAEAALAQAGYSLTCHSYPMPHTVCPEEIHDISLWLQEVSGALKLK